MNKAIILGLVGLLGCKDCNNNFVGGREPEVLNVMPISVACSDAMVSIVGTNNGNEYLFSSASYRSFDCVKIEALTEAAIVKGEKINLTGNFEERTGTRPKFYFQEFSYLGHSY